MDDNAKWFDELQAQFMITGNPLVLWRAYSIARDLQKHDNAWSPPAWIFEELDRVAARLQSLEGQLPKSASDWVDWDPSHAVRDAIGGRDWKSAVLEALGFSVPTSGPANPVLASDRDGHDLELAKRVRILVDGDRHNLTDARYLVHKATGASLATVRRAWKRFEIAARAGDIDADRRAFAILDEQCRYADENPPPQP
jgi:hypothetical protein